MNNFMPTKLDNLEEMDKSLEIHSLPWLNHKKIERQTWTVTSQETESDIDNPPTDRGRGADGFTVSLPNMHGKWTPISLKLPQGRREGNSSRLVLQEHYYLDTLSKQEHCKKKKIQTNVSNEHGRTSPKQNISKPSSVMP